MAKNQKGAGDFEISNIKIKGTSLSAQKVPTVTYRESITSPAIEVNLLISDTADSDTNLMTKLPILTGDTVDLTFKSIMLEGEEIEVSVRIYDIVSGTKSGDTSVYTLKCISPEGYLNLESRFEKLFKQKEPTDAIIPTVLSQHLKSNKKVKSGKYKSVPLTLAAMRDRPFDFIIKHVCKRSIPTNVAKGEGKGSAGYLFWETSDGYNFKPIDEVFAAPDKDSGDTFRGEKEKETYFYNAARSNDRMDEETKSRNILSFKTLSNDNAERSSIMGGKVNLVGFFDVSSLRYNETIYDLGETYSSFAHLAKGPTPTSGGSPTRIMTKVYNNEMYENTDTAAQSESYDKIRQSLSQQLVRSSLAVTNKIEINIYGNSNLHAGDKIYLSVLKGKSKSSTKENTDKKQSGYYTIATVVHTLVSTGMRTSLLLVRDTNNEET